MDCKNCFYNKACPHGYDDDAQRCPKYLDKSQVVLLPMKTTERLHNELVEHCYKRCMEEL